MGSKYRFFASIPCEGKIHSIGITKKGRFAVLDHPTKTSYARWIDWKELGGEPPPCLSVLCNFLDTIRSDPGMGVDRTHLNTDWLQYVRFHTYSGGRAGSLRELIAGCIEKRRRRRYKHGRRSNAQ